MSTYFDIVSQCLLVCSKRRSCSKVNTLKGKSVQNSVKLGELSEITCFKPCPCEIEIFKPGKNKEIKIIMQDCGDRGNVGSGMWESLERVSLPGTPPIEVSHSHACFGRAGWHIFTIRASCTGT